MTDEIIARAEGAVGRISLNRPGALHALNTAMCAAITQALLAWREDPAIALVLIDHTGERGFCAGGDLRMMAASGAGDGAEARRFFFTEYRMNALLMAYPKPVCVIMDGVVMGGGAGIALPCRYRVASERTRFAMPETGIGLFPDVGGGWHLPRLPGETGMWLALTGARIGPEDCLALGVATHHAPGESLSALKAAIIGDPLAIEAHLARLGEDPGAAALAEHRACIDAAFGLGSVEAILEALSEDGSPFALDQQAELMRKSPQALKVAHRQLALGRGRATFEDEMAQEYRIAARVVQSHDFIEGVRAVIIDKDQAPVWSPATLAGVSEAMLNAIFAPLPPGEEWTPWPAA